MAAISLCLASAAPGDGPSRDGGRTTFNVGPVRFESAGQLSDHVTALTCTLARLYRTGALHADQYTRLFHLRAEAAELCTLAEHFAATGDPRAAQAEWEARAAVAVLVMAMGGIE